MKLFFKKIKNSLIYRYRFFYFKITTFFWNLLSSLIISNARNLVAKKSLFVFVPVWGDKYIDWFFEYCFASLMQKENLPLVKEKKEIIFYFYTKGESVDYLNSSIKDNIVGFKSKVFTEDCFDDN